MGLVSEEGKGSTFWFTLPVHPDHSSPPAPVGVDTLKGLRVLVVDDLAINRRVLHEQLKNWKLEHECVASGREALTLLREAQLSGDPYHVALLDYLMPEMNGETLGQLIREDLGGQALIMLTSGGQRGDAQRLLAAGFAAYLVKPVARPAYLREVIARAVNSAGTRLLEQPVENQTRPVETPRTEDSAEAAVPQFRVLLVEDNPVNQRLACHLLKKLRCSVHVASDGCEAIEIIKLQSYDSIFMDCHMPNLDGFEATKEIRQWEGTRRRTPIIAVTANAMAGDREKCLASGMDDYITKPLKLEDLKRVLALVSSHLRSTPPSSQEL